MFHVRAAAYPDLLIQRRSTDPAQILVSRACRRSCRSADPSHVCSSCTDPCVTRASPPTLPGSWLDQRGGTHCTVVYRYCTVVYRSGAGRGARGSVRTPAALRNGDHGSTTAAMYHSGAGHCVRVNVSTYECRVHVLRRSIELFKPVVRPCRHPSLRPSTSLTSTRVPVDVS